MITKKYKMADKVIEVTSIYEKVHRYCKDYESGEAADFSVSTTQADIDFETQRELKCAEHDGRPPLNSPDDYREELAVYRKIAEKMPEYDTFLFHGSCVAVDGAAYCFTAKSGTGKSTHTRLWREMPGERAVMINDDKPLIRIRDGQATVFGTPWDGKHHLSTSGINKSTKNKSMQHGSAWILKK